MFGELHAVDKGRVTSTLAAEPEALQWVGRIGHYFWSTLLEGVICMLLLKLRGAIVILT